MAIGMHGREHGWQGACVVGKHYSEHYASYWNAFLFETVSWQYENEFCCTAVCFENNWNIKLPINSSNHSTLDSKKIPCAFADNLWHANKKSVFLYVPPDAN